MANVSSLQSTTESWPLLSQTVTSLLLESPRAEFAAKIIRHVTTTTPANEASFLGVSWTAWITMVGVLAGIVAFLLICSLICCFCCAAISGTEEEEKKKRAPAAAAPIRRRTSSVSSSTSAAPPVKTETVINKEIDHLPDGRDLTTVTSVRTTTSSNGSRNSKTSRVQFLSKKSSKHHHRGHRHHHHSRPKLTSIRPLSSQIEKQQQRPHFPMQRSRAPSSTMVEMEPTQPQPSIYHQAAVEPSSRRSPFSAPHSSTVANYNVEPQPQHYLY